jgi:NadR type nicotinamide-nucleotide adenylyltransferase
MLKRVTVTGPESTGKSKLAAWLANAYQTLWVPEYAREYLEKNGPDYSLADVEKIARGQLERENRMAEKVTQVLFCDTDLLVTKIWCEVVFGACPAWIEKQFLTHRYDLYLLCYPDIAWEPDPLRENPDNREELFALYRSALEKNKMPYRIVSGTGEARFENARTFVEEMLKS